MLKQGLGAKPTFSSCFHVSTEVCRLSLRTRSRDPPRSQKAPQLDTPWLPYSMDGQHKSRPRPAPGGCMEALQGD